MFYKRSEFKMLLHLAFKPSSPPDTHGGHKAFLTIYYLLMHTQKGNYF